ncbi:MAG TPA: maleylpyruvate isomerase family mycothiol-dependent enzyme [Actinomycetes bacterium]|nr:maleylpyruvate isomerase family mycothiol-dependent enzyme [Actinomycetes bacterium]
MSLATALTHLTELAEAEQDLRADLAQRDRAWAAAPSELPGWTRAHVVGHLAGNALGLINLVTWASTGTEQPMYPSPESRAAEIDRRAALAWDVLLAELDSAVQALQDALEHLTEPVATRVVRMTSGAPLNVADIAATRIREVQIHRVDLGAGYPPSSWSTAFTLRTCGELASFFLKHRDVPVRVLRASDTGRCWEVGSKGPDLLGAEAELLAWLIGRPSSGLRTSDGTEAPEAPTWV